MLVGMALALPWSPRSHRLPRLGVSANHIRANAALVLLAISRDAVVPKLADRPDAPARRRSRTLVPIGGPGVRRLYLRAAIAWRCDGLSVGHPAPAGAGLILTGAALQGQPANHGVLLTYAAGACDVAGAAASDRRTGFAAMKRSIGAGEWIRRAGCPRAPHSGDRARP